MKVLALHSRFSSFFSACFREAVEGQGVNIHLICSKPSSDAPFDNEIIEKSGAHLVAFREDLTVSQMMAEVERFAPDIILTSGWMFKDYLEVCRWFRKRGGKVVAFCDTAYRGSLRQRIGCLLAKWLVHPAIDVVWVAGERQREYAKRLGYRTRHLWEPMLCCDWPAFAAHRRTDPNQGEGFLFVGRLVPVKAFDILIKAYGLYRKSVSNPWPLKIIGSGPLSKMAENKEGIKLLGFVQPSHLPAMMASASAYVLPSNFEPWGVALQEAATVGLPLIASDACGASVHLLRDGWNGYLIEPGSVAELTDALIRMHTLSNDARRAMGVNSFELSKQYTPELWAATLVGGWEKLKGSVPVSEE